MLEYVNCSHISLILQLVRLLDPINVSIIINTSRPRQNGRQCPDDIFKWIFLNENVWISINISLKFVPRGPINNIPTLVQVMAWHRLDDKPLSDPMMVSLLTHICITRPQWVNCCGVIIRTFLPIGIRHLDVLTPSARFNDNYFDHFRGSHRYIRAHIHTQGRWHYQISYVACSW